MVVRYDAAVIGAGADGLAAAALLARAGLKTILLERNERVGGILATTEFCPGFWAPPFADHVAAIPQELFWELDLGRRGAMTMMASGGAGASLTSDLAVRRLELLKFASEARPPAARRGLFAKVPTRPVWPSEDWCIRSLAEIVGSSTETSPAQLAASLLDGRSCNPFAAGSAVQALVGISRYEEPVGGLGVLATALESATRAAGAEVKLGLEVTDIKRPRGRVSGICLADGGEIEARAVVSTLDLKRTFLTLFPWNELPPEVVSRTSQFRMGASRARVLFALDAPLEGVRPTTHIVSSLESIAESHANFRDGLLSGNAPVTLRIHRDPRMAPEGKTVATATLSAIPFRLFDGPWSHEKRERLCEIALSAADTVFPGFREHLVGVRVIAPPDLEEELGATEGDIFGGEIAGDQVFGYRPWLDGSCPRTPLAGLYLAGPSAAAAPYGTCVAGVVAARALLADSKAGYLK